MRCRGDCWIVTHRIDLFLGETFLKHALSILSGPPGSGKTQFTLSMLCWCIRHHRKVLYIQHGCSFVLDRVIEMLQSQGITDSSCLQDVYIENVDSAYSLFDIAEKYANVAILRKTWFARFSNLISGAASSWTASLRCFYRCFHSTTQTVDLFSRICCCISETCASNSNCRSLFVLFKILQSLQMVNQTRKTNEGELRNALHSNL